MIPDPVTVALLAAFVALLTLLSWGLSNRKIDWFQRKDFDGAYWTARVGRCWIVFGKWDKRRNS